MAEGTHGAAPLRTVVVAVPLPEEQLARWRARFPDITFVRADGDRPLGEQLDAADALIAWDLPAEDLARAPRLRWFQAASAGVDHLLSPDLVERGLLVTNARGVHAINIAEHLMAMMLAFARRLPDLVRHQDARRWEDDATRARVFELHGQTLLLVGLGAIATATAERAAAFGMRVVGVRRRPDQPRPEVLDEVAGIERLPDLLPAADHVALCLPLTPSTRGLFGDAMFQRLRPSAILYNIGRGAVVDGDALLRALEEGRLAGAGLDVTEPEPLPSDSPLWRHPDVLITAHTSGGTPHYWGRAAAIFEDNIARVAAGREPRNRVDVEEGY